MNHTKKYVVLLITLFLFTTMFTMADEKPVADVMTGSSSIHFSPKVGFQQLTITVSGPDGTVVSKSFTGGSSPYFDFSFFEGYGVVDGKYTYELKASNADKKKRRDKKSQSQTHQVLTQTGYFTVMGGAIMSNTMNEVPDRPLDQVILDDLIVDGSICVGFDCINGESFGFDTLRLKENNLRIHFQDTSTSASFPTTDWRITINDSANGGASYFSVDDADAGRKVFVLEASAPANSLYVDDYGRIGITTSTPAQDIHIAVGDTPTLRLDQDGSGGWLAQTWDVAGNEANFFIRDVTNASKLPFRIQPSTPNDTLTLKADGNVGIGTWSPSANLEIQTTGSTSKLFVTRTDGAQGEFIAKSEAVTFGARTNHAVQVTGNSQTRIFIDTTGNVGIGDSFSTTTVPSHPLEMSGGAYCTGTTWEIGSSRTLKENIHSLTTEDAKATLEGLEPVRYNYKTRKDEEYLGFIAEDVPELVATKDRKGMAPMDVVAVLTKIVQDQQERIEKLEKKIEEINKK